MVKTASEGVYVVQEKCSCGHNFCYIAYRLLILCFLRIFGPSNGVPGVSILMEMMICSRTCTYDSRSGG